jgi:phenylpropionate dioxygenase-like ring-hydroxylating dioxygenase large terminal subunit
MDELIQREAMNQPGASPAEDDGRNVWKARKHGLPVARYTDPGFAKLEHDRLWPRTWQVACRLEEIPNKGDYFVYEILDYSIVVVRQEDMSVKAFKNACPHRGTSLGVGSGHYSLGQIVCPFHGWKWQLDGGNTYILDEAGFAPECIKKGAYDLRECLVATFVNCVWINMDPAAEPFDAWIAPIRSLIDPLLLDQMYFDWHMSFELQGNWKVAQEAFFEGYHIAQTHPQLAARSVRKKSAEMQSRFEVRMLNFKTEVYPQGHGYQGATEGKYRGAGRFPKEWLEGMPEDEQKEWFISYLEKFYSEQKSLILEEDVEVARTMRNRPIPEGSNVDIEFQKVLREHYALQGRPIASAEDIARTNIIHLFPNYTFLAQFGNGIIYHTRPAPGNDPNVCIFDVWSVRTYPVGQQPPKPFTRYVQNPADPKETVVILAQDFANIPRQQVGMCSKGIDETVLHPVQEALIANMHRALDRLVGL